MTPDQIRSLSVWCAHSSHHEQWSSKALEARRKARREARSLAIQGYLVAAATSAFAVLPRYRKAAKTLQQAYISKALAAAAALRTMTEEADTDAYREIAMAWSIARVQYHAHSLAEHAPQADKEIELVLRSILGLQTAGDWSDRFAKAWKRFEASGASIDFAPMPGLPPSGELALAALNLIGQASRLTAIEEAIRVNLERQVIAGSIGGRDRGAAGAKRL